MTEVDLSGDSSSTVAGLELVMCKQMDASDLQGRHRTLKSDDRVAVKVLLSRIDSFYILLSCDA